MAKIVLGIGTSHTPQCSMGWKSWKEHALSDHNRVPFDALAAKAPSWLPDQLTDEALQKKDERIQAAIAELGQTLAKAKADVLVVFGDDEHELFKDEGVPTFAVFTGDKVWDIPRPLDKLQPYFKAAEWARHAPAPEAYPGLPKLGRHIVEQLARADFDVTQFSRQIEGRTLGHAWTFVRRRLTPDAQIPMIPITINTFSPPNNPSARRCFALGRAVRKAIESWDQDLRVAVIGSGGLTHRIIDEEQDKRVLDAMARNDTTVLENMPAEQLQSGNAETLNWIAASGALEHLRMELVDYVPGYRSIAGTGTGMTFARWS